LGTTVHVPALPGTAHDRQVPVQAVAQQIPCSQKPELHSLALPQVPPNGFLPQLPLTQLFGATQSPSLLQTLRQAPSVPHWKGAQFCPGAVTQVPLPSQRDASVSVVPEHIWALQIDPDG
jgi:hypothetical protein